MPLINTVWNLINPEFVGASSISSLRFVRILLIFIHVVLSVIDGHCLSYLSLLSNENFPWIFVFDQRPLWSSLKTKICHKRCIDLYEVASVLCGECTVCACARITECASICGCTIYIVHCTCCTCRTLYSIVSLCGCTIVQLYVSNL